MTAHLLDDLEAALACPVERPGSPGYTRSTTPRNATAHQAPAAVARVRSAEDVAACVRWAAAHGMQVQPQATGHGAAGAMGDDVLLVDTAGLDHLSIDAEAATARVGAGVRWADVQAAAQPHGLLGLAGTTGDVGVVGYLFRGGVGWLSRPYGLAAARVHALDWVDGTGRVRRATDDAADPLDRDALWAARGGGGVGIVTAVEIGLSPVPDLWAGLLLWPVEHLEAVATAWARALPHVDPSVTSSLGVLGAAPDAPLVPEDLRGKALVHLAVASVHGERAVATLRDALPDLAPAVDTLGPADAQRLGGIHLDPPAAIPARGEGRWLALPDPDDVLAILTAAGAPDASPLAETELRHVGPAVAAASADGALTALPGPVVLHAVGAAPDPKADDAVTGALAAVRAAAGRIDTGRGAPAFRDGRTTAPSDALDEPTARRVALVRAAADPDGVLRRPRVDE